MTVYGLIGYPLEHSRSPDIFRDIFKKEGIADHLYELYPIKPIHDFPRLLSRVPGLAGLNVTIPYKKQVLPFLHCLDDTARETGAVNTVAIKYDEAGASFLTGYNTDVTGLEKAISEFVPGHHSGWMILGSGGAALAAQYVARKNGYDFICVSRNPKHGYITYADITADILEKYSLVINCTPAGMFPDIHVAPEVPYHLLTTANALFDMVYNPQKTRFMTEGEKRGCVVCGGWPMLIYQAEAAWEIWKNVKSAE